MKTIFLSIFILAITSIANAETCTVSSIYSELEVGLNKETICLETLASLSEHSIPIHDHTKLEISANGDRTMYSVVLDSITVFDGNSITYDGKGFLHWYPGEAYVILY
tara:strand:- start:64946 stop:65269 length:324 start_codon:yes stop_codon:yes gene_type:complete